MSPSGRVVCAGAIGAMGAGAMEQGAGGRAHWGVWHPAGILRMGAAGQGPKSPRIEKPRGKLGNLGIPRSSHGRLYMQAWDTGE